MTHRTTSRQQQLLAAEPSKHPSTYRTATDPIRVHELGTVDYRQALALQRDLATRRRAGGNDHLLLLEHPTVYTAGRRTQPHERPTDATPVIDVDRGGKATWHGPGQLVGYPIVQLTTDTSPVTYLRVLEQALLHVCDQLGLTAACRIPGRSGVWMPPTAQAPARKLAAIGINIRHNITTHGFALNANCDLSAYDRIIPCGLTDTTVTSLTTELRRPVTVAEIRPLIRDSVTDALDGKLTLTDHPAGPTVDQ